MKPILILGAVGAFFFMGGAVTQAQTAEEPRPEREAWGELSEEERQERRERFREMSREDRRAMWRERRQERETAQEEETRTGLEFRSMLRVDGETEFSIRDHDADRTVWLKEGDTRGGIRVVSFDQESGVLTIEHDDETRELSLAHSRVAELDEEAQDRERRMERMRERREQFREFHGRWQSAVEDSPQLQEIDTHFREIGREMWELRRAMRETERGSSDRRLFRREMRELHEEMGLLSELATHEMRENPAFEEQDIEMVERFSRILSSPRGARRGGGRGR